MPTCPGTVTGMLSCAPPPRFSGSRGRPRRPAGPTPMRWVSLVGDTVNSSGVLGFEVGQVDGAGGVEGFLRGAGRESGAERGVFVAVAGGGVDREAEGV